MSFEEFAAEYRHMHNHMCIAYDSELVRLVGVAAGEYDLYYIVQSKGYQQEQWYSAVGWLYSIKGMLPDEKYKRLENHWNINNEPVHKFKEIKQA